ncbi:MAG TPA: nucleotidyltransferase family protein [Steroidobacteraceae bacterium]|nr:nucleotidyltransferase family protein [Steroidobacteraceae bacterium]
MAPIIADRRAATCAVIILAAGGSRRLGRPKQLVHRGAHSLVVRAVDAALGLAPLWVGVVVGASASRVAAELRGRPVQIVQARRWRDGLSMSLRAGLARVPRSATHVLVMTIDQWAIRGEDLRRLLASRGRVPLAAGYAGRAGVPAVFPKRWWRALAALQGDRGARQLLDDPRVRRVPLPAAEADLDTLEELRFLKTVGHRPLPVRSDSM